MLLTLCQAVADNADSATIHWKHLAYGVQLTKDEAWKHITQFIRAAGLTFAGCYFGSQILSLILTSTGVGYPVAVAMDAAISGAIAYAVGAAAKAYFKGERNNAELGRIMRERFKQLVNDPKPGRFLP